MSVQAQKTLGIFELAPIADHKRKIGVILGVGEFEAFRESRRMLLVDVYAQRVGKCVRVRSKEGVYFGEDLFDQILFEKHDLWQIEGIV